MANRYQVSFTKAAVKQLEELTATVRGRVIAATEDLGGDPRPFGAKKLSGQTDTYRIRVGSYRVIYEIEDDRLIVLVLRIADRKDAYRGL